MTEKKDDFATWGILGVLGAIVVGAIATAVGGAKLGQGVNSYQTTNSYSPPPPPSSGCGCSAGR